MKAVGTNWLTKSLKKQKDRIKHLWDITKTIPLGSVGTHVGRISVECHICFIYFIYFKTLVGNGAAGHWEGFSFFFFFSGVKKHIT